jgi:hypothetical protein
MWKKKKKRIGPLISSVSFCQAIIQSLTDAALLNAPNSCDNEVQGLQCATSDYAVLL